MDQGGKKTWITVLVLLVFVGLFAFAVTLALWQSRSRIERRTILEVDLQQAYPEYQPYGLFAPGLFEQPPSLRSVVRALDEAAADDRVVGLVARLGAAPMGLADVQEVRDAVLRFRGAGKPAVAWADTFGEFSQANFGYYLASAFDRIHLQPSGDVGLTGLLYESVFYRDLFDKLDVLPRLGQRYEYKNAANSYVERQHTAAHEEALQALADSHVRQLTRGIAAGRELEPAAVRAAFDGGPYVASEALAAGLVDSLDYRDAVYEALEEELEEADFLSLAAYLRRLPAAVGGHRVALIYGVGAVVRGESGYDAWSGEQKMGSDTVTEAFRRAIDDDGVEAILFRVDSPGGSYVASDSIWRETVRAREAGKPVVVSMSDLAGSGGYFVAMAADVIVAQPGTLTGSIGVFGGKLVVRALWERLGITFDEVTVGERARIWSSNHDYADEEWRRMEELLDRIYADFTTKVADGRSLSPEDVEAAARGRVWTGEDALQLGLVDRLGGWNEALSAVREELGLSATAKLRLVTYPRIRSPFELLAEGRWWTAARGARTAELEGWRELAPPLARLARELGLSPEAVEPLRMRVPLAEVR